MNSDKKKDINFTEEDNHENFLEVISDLINLVRFGLRVDRMGTWSEKLEGIRLLDLHILKLAAENPEILLGEIRAELIIPNSTLTSAIDRLERKNLLERVISQRDRRSYELQLTKEGRLIREEHRRVDLLIGSLVLEAMDNEKEIELLIKLLEKILEEIS